MKQQGFVLVTTIWILAIIAMAAGFFAMWTERTIQTAHSLQDDVQAQIDMHNTKVSIIYLLTTQRFSYAGLVIPESEKNNDAGKTDEEMFEEMLYGKNISYLPLGSEILLDDRVYKGLGQARFSLQDESGLLNPNRASLGVFDRFLHLLGIKLELTAPLIAKLQDYTDLGDYHLINGAESYQYEQRDFFPPPNKLFLSTAEVQHVLDWKQHDILWQDHRWLNYTTVRAHGLPRLNTAPAITLQAGYGFDEDTAKRIVAAREIKMPHNEYVLKETTGVDIELYVADLMDVMFFPSNILRLTLWHENLPYMQRLHLRLTPAAHKQAPWYIEQTLRLPMMPMYSKSKLYETQTVFLNPKLSTQKDM